MDSHEIDRIRREVYGFDANGRIETKAGTISLSYNGWVSISFHMRDITPTQLDAIRRVLDGG